jgi:aryl-alcohol dehydrogenase-like predicted oxidoreductase
MRRRTFLQVISAGAAGVLTSLAHLEENMAAEKLQLSADEWKKIGELVRS